MHIYTLTPYQLKERKAAQRVSVDITSNEIFIAVTQQRQKTPRKRHILRYLQKPSLHMKR